MLSNLSLDVVESTDGGFIATVRDMPGIVAHGETPAEAMANVAQLAVEAMMDADRAQQTQVQEVEPPRQELFKGGVEQ